LTYERKFLKYLERRCAASHPAGQLFPHHWIYFTDEAGPGWAQPDFFLVEPRLVTVFETKLTQTTAAWEQLDGLYGPLLEYLFARPVRKVQVCKNLLADDGTLISRWDEIRSGATFHWTR
jgi:hypothetical protein